MNLHRDTSFDKLAGKVRNLARDKELEGSMSVAKSGDKVKIHYTGKLMDGRVFDSSKERQPLEFTLGNGDVIAGFDKGIAGMAIGESKRIEILPEDAYGERRAELVINIKKNEFPDDITPSVGLQLEIKSMDGEVTGVVITEVGDDIVTLDANHPLAGQTLLFDVELVGIS